MTDIKDRRSNGIGDNTVTIKTWVLIVLIITFVSGVTGVGFASLMNHESRTSTLETKVANQTCDITEIKQMLRDIRNDQIRRYEKAEGGK